MIYEEAVSYIAHLPKFRENITLSHTEECLTLLGNPQDSFSVIHVAGTNGKGSTCAFLASILQQAGYSCGLFTSPHLVKMNERFMINGEIVDDGIFLDAFHKVYALSGQLERAGEYPPTFFEFFLLMGMLIFSWSKVEYVVLETGMGGKMDATTAVRNPIACVITSISLDHTAILGNTTSKIAAEKAGILVPKVPIIFDGNDPEAAGVIEEAALDLDCPRIKVRKEDTQIEKLSKDGISFKLKRSFGDEIFRTALPALYQVMNAGLALETIRTLLADGKLKMDLDVMKKGLLSACWPGRMETVLPGVILDGAHNEDGIRKFVETAQHFVKEAPLSLLFSAVDDKDYTQMIHLICTIPFVRITITSVGGSRALDPAKLEGIFRIQGNQNITVIENTDEAFVYALKEKGREGMLFCVGSLYLVGEIKAFMERSAQKEEQLYDRL